MRNLKSSQAFTLIEIAVVLIIIGLIAVFAFPGLFAQIERHKGQEALSNLNLIKSSIESCGVQSGYNFANCNTWDAVGIANPTGGSFTYGTSTNIAFDAGTPFAQGTYSIVATRTTAPNDTITITRDSNGISHCNGIGVFGGFC